MVEGILNLVLLSLSQWLMIRAQMRPYVFVPERRQPNLYWPAKGILTLSFEASDSGQYQKHDIGLDGL